jgi:adenine C2-methylase RlmN of 23S rRNA A2503 and tRNA A37
LASLFAVLRRYFPLSPTSTVSDVGLPAPAASSKGDNFVVLEYVMLGGVNDSLEDARRLVDLTSDVYCMINLIVFNPFKGTPFVQSSDNAVCLRSFICGKNVVDLREECFLLLSSILPIY